jgi:hypothetical protein
MLITLQQIRDVHPCLEGWTTLLKSLGNPTDMSVTVSFGDIAKSNGAQDALWCLRCISDRRFAVSLIMPAAKRASVHSADQRVHYCIAAIGKWLAGDEAVDLMAARAAAYAAAYAAAAADADSAARAAAYAAYAAAADARADARSAAASDSAWAAAAADSADVERKQQMEDIISLSPLHALKEKQ